MTDLLTDYLWNDDLFGFFVAFYADPIGEGFALGFVIYIVLVVFHLRYESIGATIVLILLLTSGLISLIPVSAYRIIGIFLALGLGGLLTAFFTRR